MMLRLAVAAAAMAAGLALGGGAAAAARPASGPVTEFVGPSWRTAYEADLPGSAAFTGVAATGRASAWAAGVRLSRQDAVTGAFAARWNGKKWRLVAVPGRNFLPETVAASSAANVWLFGLVRPPAAPANPTGMVLHLVGGRWRQLQLPPDTWNQGTAMQALVFGPHDVWLSGGQQTTSSGAVETRIWQWSGTNWSSTELPGMLRTLSGSSVRDMWATSTASDSGEGAAHLYRFVSATWTRQHAPGLWDASVAVHSPADIWLTGYTYQQRDARGASTAARWNGRRWYRYTVVTPAGTQPTITDGRGGLWDGQSVHETGGRWYVPASVVIFPRGCEPNGFLGGLAGVPGTAATWAASGCTPLGKHRERAIIAVNGRL